MTTYTKFKDIRVGCENRRYTDLTHIRDNHTKALEDLSKKKHNVLVHAIEALIQELQKVFGQLVGSMEADKKVREAFQSELGEMMEDLLQSQGNLCLRCSNSQTVY
jgi:hypothetical protein